MDSQLTMDKFLYILKNGFIIEDREQYLDSFSDFAITNKFVVMEAISKVEPWESEVFWNFLDAVSGSINFWSDFILTQLARLLRAADTEEDPIHIISSLEAFELLIEVKDHEFISQVTFIIKAFLDTENKSLQKFLIWLFSSFKYKTN